MALSSSDVNAGDDILAADHNNLRDDVINANITTATRYLSISIANLVCKGDATPRLITREWAKSSSNTDDAYGFAPINLPHGAVITSLKVYWYRDDAASSGQADLYRCDHIGNAVAMAAANSNATTGYHSVEDTTITNATIDNVDYHYLLRIQLDPNDAAGDVRFQGAVITYTIDVSLP